MSESRLKPKPPEPKFDRLERVVVETTRPLNRRFEGEKGAILWSDHHGIWSDEKRRFVGAEWVHVVSFDSGGCGTMLESEIRSLEDFDTPMNHIGRRHELSFDPPGEDEHELIEGYFRVPGRLWEIFIFTHANVQEMTCHESRWPGEIPGLVFEVPLTVRLDRSLAKKVLADRFEEKSWEEV